MVGGHISEWLALRPKCTDSGVSSDDSSCNQSHSLGLEVLGSRPGCIRGLGLLPERLAIAKAEGNHWVAGAKTLHYVHINRYYVKLETLSESS